MARARLELATHRASIYCYYQLSYQAERKMIPLTEVSNEPSRVRTCETPRLKVECSTN